MLYCLKRICDPCKEHVDNKFTPLSERATNEFIPVRDEIDRTNGSRYRSACQ